MYITSDKAKYALGTVLTAADVIGELEECQAHLLKNGACTKKDMVLSILGIRSMTKEEQWVVNEEAMNLITARDYFWRK